MDPKLAELGASLTWTSPVLSLRYFSSAQTHIGGLLCTRFRRLRDCARLGKHLSPDRGPNAHRSGILRDSDHVQRAE